MTLDICNNNLKIIDNEFNFIVLGDGNEKHKRYSIIPLHKEAKTVLYLDQFYTHLISVKLKSPDLFHCFTINSLKFLNSIYDESFNPFEQERIIKQIREISDEVTFYAIKNTNEKTLPEDYKEMNFKGSLLRIPSHCLVSFKNIFQKEEVSIKNKIEEYLICKNSIRKLKISLTASMLIAGSISIYFGFFN